MIQVLSQMITLSVAVGTIVYAVPFFLVPAFVIAYIHLWFARGYINASRDLRRIESNTRSPIVSSFSELVVGIVTGTSTLDVYALLQLICVYNTSACIRFGKVVPKQHVPTS
jgi:hypothetical protein